MCFECEPIGNHFLLYQVTLPAPGHPYLDFSYVLIGLSAPSLSSIQGILTLQQELLSYSVSKPFNGFPMNWSNKILMVVHKALHDLIPVTLF